MGRREEKAKATREAILSAAVEVVGRLGYARASMSRIAEAAGISTGLIYHYFPTQQDLFNELLPTAGEAMLRYIAEAARGIEDLAERERVSFEANMRYLEDHPALVRIQAEATYFAPETHRRYLQRLSRAYQRSLMRSRDQGRVALYSPEELETLSMIFIGARQYLLERYAIEGERVMPLPPEVQRTYLKAIWMALGLTVPPSA